MFINSTRKPVVFFSPKDGGGGNAEDKNGEEEEHEEDPNTEEENGGNNGKKSQKELDREFASRAKRASEAATKKLWEALGVTTQEEFDAYVKAKRENEDKAKTELQKKADEAAREKTRADKLEAESKTKIEEMQMRIQNSEIKIVASKAVFDKDGKKLLRGAIRTDALDDVLVLIDRSKIKEEEDGTYSGIEKAVEELTKKKPWLLEDGQATTRKSNTPGPRYSGKKPIAENDDERDPLIFNSL